MSFLGPFLEAGSPASLAFQQVQDILLQQRWPFAVFGGSARDIALLGPSANPRDIDLVVDCESRLDLKRVLRVFNPTMNGFSGFSFELGGVPFDIWRLRDTWAFWQPGGPLETKDGHGVKTPVLKDLLRTTFFNIEEIIVELPAGTVHDAGMRAAFRDRVLELNHPHNPYPLLCLIRTAVFAKRFGLRLGPRLEEWIYNHRPEVKEGLLSQVQRRYYGEQLVTREELETLVEAASEATRARSRATVP